MTKGYLRQGVETLNQAVLAYINGSLHESLRKNDEIRYRARMLLLLVYLFSGLFSLLLLVMLAAPFENQIKAIGVGIWLFFLFSFALINYLLQVRGAYWMAGHVMLGALTTVTVFGIAITGGPAISPVTELLLFFPLLCFYLMGLFLGFVWSLFNVLLLVAFFILAALEVAFVNLIPDPFYLQASIIIYISGFISLFLMIMIYENTLVSLHEQQQKSESQVRYLATHDQLTGIANRVSFYKTLEAAILKHRHNGGEYQLALVYMDLVGFKEVNDQYGHPVGDLVLQGVARNLEAGTRGTDIVARHGGDEFVILLKRVKDERALEVIADKIADIVTEPVDVPGMQLQVEPSMGIAFYPGHAKDLVALERCADEAMYEAKSSGRYWKVFNGKLSDKACKLAQAGA